MPFVNASSAIAANAGTDLLPVALTGAKMRTALAEFTFASDAAGTYTVPIRIPRGARVTRVAFNLSASAGASATLALGIAGATGKYRAAATLTSTDQWVESNLNAAMGAVLTAEEQLLLTTAVAALPSSGRMLILVSWLDNT